MTAPLRLKVWLVEQTAVFELSWGSGQQLTAQVSYPHTLTRDYRVWQQTYLKFYQSALRARSQWSGVIASPAIDWRAELVQAEAQFLSEFHTWLRAAELFAIRRQITTATRDTAIDLFVTCNAAELARLPWEVWEIVTDSAATNPIRIVRSPAMIRAETRQRDRRGKTRILAVLGDDSGLDFRTEREALKSLAWMADVTLIGWQQGRDNSDLKEQIRATIADPQGWDILFFAGHSNETELTGGELAISPHESILISEIIPALLQAKERGLQFAIFNSCKGLSIANSLIDIGLSQVAVMREPIHNQVAQEFLVRFVQGIAQDQDVHDALLSAGQHLKLERNLTYPSAYLVPSLFRHPDSVPFQPQPVGWRQHWRQWVPTKREAIALTLLLGLSSLVPMQEWLLAQRVWVQAQYRHLTGQVAAATPPIVLVQIDDASIQKLGLSQVEPMDRRLLGQLVQRVTQQGATVIGMDYLLDLPQPQDRVLQSALRQAVQHHRAWLVFAAKRNKARQWIGVRPELASPQWSLSGDIWTPYWRIRPLPWTTARLRPFAYELATAAQIQQQLMLGSPLQPPRPDLRRTAPLAEPVATYVNQVGEPLVRDRMRLHPLTAFSYRLCHPWFGAAPPCHRWLQPLLDFSIPPGQVYHKISAWELLSQPEAALRSRQLTSLQSRIVIIAPGGYDQAGITQPGEDNPTLPEAIAFWRHQVGDPDETFTGGEIHAYMAHHFLTQRLVVPIPDLWLVAVAAVLAKAGVLLLAERPWRVRRLTGLLGLGTLGYGLLSLQLYLSAAVLLPWLLPSITVWSYVQSTITRKTDA